MCLVQHNEENCPIWSHVPPFTEELSWFLKRHNSSKESPFLGINYAELAHVLFASSSKLQMALFAIKACPASQMSQLEGSDHPQLMGHMLCSVAIFPANTSFYLDSLFVHFWSGATALIPGISAPLPSRGKAGMLLCKLPEKPFRKLWLKKALIKPMHLCGGIGPAYLFTRVSEGKFC